MFRREHTGNIYYLTFGFRNTPITHSPTSAEASKTMLATARAQPLKMVTIPDLPSEKSSPEGPCTTTRLLAMRSSAGRNCPPGLRRRAGARVGGSAGFRRKALRSGEEEEGAACRQDIASKYCPPFGDLPFGLRPSA